MKTPIRILFWSFLHDQAEGLWGYIWRKKLAPYHEQQWKEKMERLGPVEMRFIYVNTETGQTSLPNPTAPQIYYTNYPVETEKERMN